VPAGRIVSPLKESAMLWALGTPTLELVFRASVIYIVFFAALRLFGKREIGQFTLFDLALVLLAANALQPAMTRTDSSLTGGLVLVVTPLVIDRAVAFLRVRFPAVRRLLDFQPTIVGRDGKWILREMVRQGIDLVDVEESTSRARPRRRRADEARDARGGRLHQHRGKRRGRQLGHGAPAEEISPTGNLTATGRVVRRGA
jgi:hypothetical protein